jgi:type I restriction enzyme S subunit
MSSEWPLVRLEEVTSVLGDGLHGTPIYDDEGSYHFINGNNLLEGRIFINEKTKRVSEVEAHRHRKSLNERTILVSINGTLGNIAFYRGEKVVLGKSACYFNVDVGVDKHFVRYVLQSEAFQNYIQNLATGSTIKNVSLRLMRDFSFQLPPFEVQKHISAVLKVVDDRITLLRETNVTLEAIAQTLFKSWFVDFDPVRAKAEGRQPEGMDATTAALFPDSFEDAELGLVPKGWRRLAFTETVKVIGGGTPKTSVPEYWDGDIPWFSVVDAPVITDVFVIDTVKHISSAGLNSSSTKLLPEGTTIISARGTVGRLALVGKEMAMNQSCYGLQGKAGDAYFTYFSTYRLVESLKQKSHGSVFDTITTETMKSVSVIYPDVSVIETFEAVVSPVMRRMKANLQQAQTLSQLRDTLLPRLISGQLRLPEARQQMEDALA